ncbi:MAG: hypothetical protein LBC63_05265 [Holophagales bacterium]|jgi:hypothetical protein|nr:hypothetical protein [Holophagales bacterium]
MGWHANGGAWFRVTDVHRNSCPVICGVCKKFVKFQKIAKNLPKKTSVPKHFQEIDP